MREHPGREFAPSPHDASERYRPLSGRRRLLILLLAMVTAVSVILTLLDPPGGVARPRAANAASAASAVQPGACPPGQSQGCVGGMAQVLVPVAPVR